MLECQVGGYTPERSDQFHTGKTNDTEQNHRAAGAPQCVRVKPVNM